MLTLTGAQILAFVGVSTPTPEQTSWANAVASAIVSGITVKLNGVVIESPSDAEAELNVACLLAGAEAYKRQEATFGSAGFADLEGTATSLARDYLTGVAPLIDRYSAGPGIG